MNAKVRTNWRAKRRQSPAVLWARGANGWQEVFRGTAEQCAKAEAAGHAAGERLGVYCSTAVLPIGQQPENC